MRILALSIALALGGCKPSEEPERRPTAGVEVALANAPREDAIQATERVAAAAPVIAEVVVGSPGPADVPVVADAGPDVGPDLPGDAATDASGPEATAGGPDVQDVPELAVAAGTGGGAFDAGLSDALRAALSAPARDGARDEARRLNKLGLTQHKKRALDAAIAHYEAALVAYPAFPFARYNLACALALEQQDAAALFHLGVLAWLADERGDQTSRDRLAAARIDPDFDRLRADERFRELTGATDILVAWAPTDEARAEARRWVKALRDARWPARVATSGWRLPLTTGGVRVVAGDPIAERAARAVVEVLTAASGDASPWPIDIGAELPPKAPPIVVLVLPAPGEPASPPTDDAPAADEPRDELEDPTATEGTAPEPAPEPGRVTGLVDALGKVLRAERTVDAGVERHRLELKPTGFFTWAIDLPEGGRVKRAGRWSGNGRQLTLSFTETATPADGGAETTIEGQRLELPITPGDGLGLAGMWFR